MEVCTRFLRLVFIVRGGTIYDRFSFFFFFCVSHARNRPPPPPPPLALFCSGQVDAKRIYREMFILRHTRHTEIIRLIDVVLPTSYDGFRDLYLVSELDIYIYISYVMQQRGESRPLSFLPAIICFTVILLNRE